MNAQPAQYSVRIGARSISARSSSSSLNTSRPKTKVLSPSLFQRQPWNGQTKPVEPHWPWPLASRTPRWRQAFLNAFTPILV